jgi:tetratricopeptide (TPR) repeat protein
MKLSGITARVLTAILLAPSVAWADSYDEAFARARGLEARGDLPGAAAELSAILADYPQDYALVIELAWLRFQAGQYQDAERGYREAIRRSPAALDAHLGLGWSLARQGRCPEALSSIQRYVDIYPTSPRGQDALAACAAPATPTAGSPTAGSPVASPWASAAPLPTTVTVGVAWGGARLPSHPIKTGASGVTVGADAALWGTWLLGGVFRSTSVSTVDGSGVDPFVQREFYAYAGLATAQAGLVLHLASIHDGSGTTGTSTHAGVSTRLSGAAGDGLLSAYISSYSDKAILRVEPSWRVPLGEHFSIVPGVALQRTSTETLATAQLTLVLDGAAGRLWFGGKYGTEDRPAYLLQSVVDNVTEKIRGGLWAGGRLVISPHLAATAQYAFDRLVRTDNLTPATSAMHTFSLGLAATF